MKNTTIKIDARDWTGDPRIRMLSLAARGLWLECLCLMRTAPRTGYLETTAGTPFSDGALARIACAQEADITALRRELADNAIPSVEEGTGVWYCRRMAAEAARSEKCSAAGRKGGGNPAFAAATAKEAAPRRTRAPAKDGSNGATPSALQAPSADPASVPFASLMSPQQSSSAEFTAAWIQWIDFRRHKKNAIQDNTARLQLSKLSMQTDIATQVAIIEQSIMQGWTGLFDLKTSSASMLLRNPSTRVRPVMDKSADDFAGQIDAAMERSAKEQ